MQKIILSVKNIDVKFEVPEGEVSAVTGLSFDLKEGENLAIVGESGSGKSQSFLSIMGLLAKNGRATGEAILDGVNILNLPASKLDKYRGDEISMIFQDPMTSLNPSMTVLSQLSEVLIKHQNKSKKEAKEKVLNMLNKVGIPEAEKRLKSYPHELSGGMRQRVMIAMALLCEPKIIIADEPTTALDVTIQAQILDLFGELQNEFNSSLVMITHDLGVVAGLCDSMIVMYGGRVVEKGTVLDLFKRPKHPYTLGLLQSTPNIEDDDNTLTAIPGLPPNLQDLPKGCSFSPRCPFKTDRCLNEMPELEKVADDQFAACFYKDLTIDMAGKFLTNIES